MGQIPEGSIDAQNIAKTLIEVIVGEVMNTLGKRTDHQFESFGNLNLQSFENEKNLVCVKSEGMNLEETKIKENSDQSSINDICCQNQSESCIHSSILSTQGEGDFQPPNVRETKAFYNLGSEGISCKDQTCIDSSQSSVDTSFTDELIAQLHADINDVSFDNIHLSDSEVEKELQNTECNCKVTKKVNQCSQTNSLSHFEEDFDSGNKRNDHELRHSSKFSHLNEFLEQYFKVNENTDDNEEEIEQEPTRTSSEVCNEESNNDGCIDNCSQTNPFANPFIFCQNVNSTIALSSDCCEMRDEVCESVRLTDKDHQSNEWIEANEVQIRITEPGCSKDYLQSESVENDVEAVQTNQYWSNVGLITEHAVDRRYLGPVELPGIESIKGVPRVQEKYLTSEPEKILWISKVESLENTQQNSENTNVNYLSLPRKSEVGKRKKKFVSRLGKAISSIFKFSNKDPKE